MPGGALNSASPLGRSLPVIPISCRPLPVKLPDRLLLTSGEGSGLFHFVSYAEGKRGEGREGRGEEKGETWKLLLARVFLPERGGP